MKYITRVLSDNVDGYQVRLPEIENGKMVKGTKEKVNRLFSLSAHKSLKGCLAAAKKWRDNHLKKHKALGLLDEPCVNKKGVLIEDSGRNSTGVIGVSRYTQEKYCLDSAEISEYLSYKAQWRIFVGKKFKNGSRQFSIDRHGECTAFKWACEARYKAVGEIIVTDVELVPCLPDVPYRLMQA